MSLLFFCWCCCLRLQVTRKKVLWLQIIAARNEENPRIIGEKNLTLQCLVSAAIVSLMASLMMSLIIHYLQCLIPIMFIGPCLIFRNCSVFAPSIKEGVGRTTGLVFVNTVSLPDCQEENEWVRVWCLYYCLVQEQLCNLLFT